jgi:hypothetical protein
MAARMEIIKFPGRRLHSPQVILKNHPREFLHVLLIRAGVQRVGRVGDNPIDAALPAKIPKRPYVVRIDRLRGAAPRVPRKKRKRVGAERGGALSHSEVSSRRRNMAPDPKHPHSPSVDFFYYTLCHARKKVRFIKTGCFRRERGLLN